MSSTSAAAQHFVANLSNQPVELHLPSGHQVLPPRGRATLAPSDLDAPQLQALRRSRVVIFGELPAPAEDPEPPAPDPAKTRSGKSKVER